MTNAKEIIKPRTSIGKANIKKIDKPNLDIRRANAKEAQAQYQKTQVQK